jgi:methionyl-tRNA formyltransferase
VPIADLPNDGALRKRLAQLAGDMVPELVGLWDKGVRPTGRPQDPGLVTHAPRPTAEDGFLERLPTADAIRRAVRALNPFPGTSIAVDGRRVSVDRCSLIERWGPAQPRLHQDVVEVGIDSMTLRLFRTSVPLTATRVPAVVNS